ncbi:hypothetical protein J6590_024345 [Homalodisca vitripennis]|nr:hypothetical protein J6590_024345 [Homalodisca vitripennis]
MVASFGKWKSKDSVEHVFPVVGHTMLPCDRDFGRVGNFVRDHVQYIYSPDDWGRVLQQAQKNYFIYRMLQEDFFKVSALKEFFTPHVGYIASATKIKISASNPDSINVSKTYFGEPETISIRPRGRRLSGDMFIQQFNTPLQSLYRKPIPVPKTKKNDVLSLLKYVPEVYHTYYREVTTINDNEVE